jgi:hypothetical protein
MKAIPGKNGKDIRIKYAKVTSPGPSQLIRYSVLATNNHEPHSNYERDYMNTEFNAFHPASDPQRGWPHHCKLISITNGSRLGTLQDNYDDYLQTSGGGSQTYLNPGDMCLDINGLLDVDMYALPNFSSSKEKILDVSIANWPSLIQLNNLTTLVDKEVRLKNCLPLDNGPGSFRWTIRDGYSALDDMGSYEYHIGNNTPKYFKHCFIPIASAMGLKNFENIMQNNLSTATTVFQGGYKFKDPNHVHSFFDVVYAPTENQGHVQITDENINWVMQILNDCDEEVIKFQNEVIPSGTYTACNEIDAGENVGKFPNCNESVLSGYTTTIIRKYLDGVNYNATTYSVPPATPDGGSVQTLCSNCQDGYDTDSYYEWSVSTPNYNFIIHCGPATIQNGSNVLFHAGNQIDLQPGFEVEAGATFDASIFNSDLPACSSSGRYGTTNTTGQPVASTRPTFSKGTKSTNSTFDLPDHSIKNELLNFDFNLIPNPANNKTTLSYNLDISSIVEIEITSIYGQQISKNKTETLQNTGIHIVELDLNKLSKGVYFVTVRTGNSKRTKQLMIN